MVSKIQMTRNRVFGLDCIRAVSILMILFSHSSWIYNSDGWLGKLQDFSGFIGVELFLVLSGFLVGGIVYKLYILQSYTRKEVWYFLKRRLLRVLPNYYFVTTINLVIALFLGFSISYVWKYYLLIQNFTTSIPAFFPETWSLPIKELSYVALTILLLLFNFISAKYKEHFFLFVVLLMLLGSFVLKIYYNYNSSTTSLEVWSLQLRSVVIYRIDTVMMGIVLSYVYFRFPDKIINNNLILLLIGMVFFLALIFCIAILKLRLDNAAWFWNIICLPFLALAICFILPFFIVWKTAPKRLESIISKVCDWSYSIYLVHYSIVLYLIKILINTDELAFFGKTVVFLAYVNISFLLGYLLYTFFEKPINDYRNRISR